MHIDQDLEDFVAEWTQKVQVAIRLTQEARLAAR